MARSGRETARKIKSRHATLYSSSGDELSGGKEQDMRKSKVNKLELSPARVLLHSIMIT